ncbi:MAG: ATP-dependent helicase/nuclease subunit, partial [Planctomycetota bacterium]
MCDSNHGPEDDDRVPSEVPDKVVRPRRILASAGTGKTWNLVGRYVGLVLSGFDPAKILATTFTRAAAAEIRDRVFRDLSGLVLDEERRLDPDDQFKCGVISDAQAAAALERLVQELPRLQIRTLDSVFASLARGLGAASGVAGDARLVEGEGAADLLREAISGAIEDTDEDEVLATLETLGRGSIKRGVVSTIESAVAGLLQLAEESTPDAWFWSHPPRDESLLDRLRSIHATLDAAVPTLEKASHADAIRKLLPLVEVAIERDGAVWSSILKSAMVVNVGPGKDGRYFRSPISDAIVPALAELHDLAIGGNLRNLAGRTACLRHLVDAIGPRYRQAKREARVVEFDDYTRALDDHRGGIPPELLGELWFRLDTRLDHLLLDEFQDTSATQLRAIRPLAQEILAGGDEDRRRSLFVVGDVKQSIYGWRGADPAILERLDLALRTTAEAIPSEPLIESHRSSQAVIDLVNTVFSSIGENPAVLGRSMDAAAHFTRNWEAHKTAKKSLPGEAIVEFLPDSRAGGAAERDRVLAAAAAASAKRLVERHPHGTVAVIVRSNRVIGAIVEALRELGVDARGQGGGSLLDAEAATVVIQAFRLAADPSDSMAAEDIARSPLGPLLDLQANPADPHRPVAEADRRRAAERLRRRLDADGAAAVVDDWRRRLADQLTRREAIRLRQMVELLERFDVEVGAPRMPRDIERHLRTCRVPDPGGEGVVVMTVHQSKGLEFDGVVVTEMHQSLFKVPAIAVATPAIPADPIDRVSTWYSESTRPKDAMLIHEQVTTRFVTEALCGLYVALTRAARDLVVHVQPPAHAKGNASETAGSLHSWGGVVRKALEAGGTDGAEGGAAPTNDGPSGQGGGDSKKVGTTFESDIASGLEGAIVVHQVRHRPSTPEGGSDSAGRPSKDASVDPAAAGSSRPGTPKLRIAASASRRRAVSVPPPSSSHHRADLLRRSDPAALERGSVVHALFERVERAADIDRLDDATLLAVARSVAPGRDDAWHRDRLAAVRAALAVAAVRDAYDGTSGPSLV